MTHNGSATSLQNEDIQEGIGVLTPLISTIEHQKTQDESIAVAAGRFSKSSRCRDSEHNRQKQPWWSYFWVCICLPYTFY
jgi:ACS family pantothenate transporter-like MFS transporter